MRPVQMIHSRKLFESQCISQDCLDLEDLRSFAGGRGGVGVGGSHDSSCNSYTTMLFKETLRIKSASGMRYCGGRF